MKPFSIRVIIYIDMFYITKRPFSLTCSLVEVITTRSWSLPAGVFTIKCCTATRMAESLLLVIASFDNLIPILVRRDFMRQKPVRIITIKELAPIPVVTSDLHFPNRFK